MDRALTREELLGLPAVIDIPTAGRAFGLPRSTSYGLVQRGEFPVNSFKLGRRLRVLTVEVYRALGLEQR